jgi:hypothetical protein
MTGERAVKERPIDRLARRSYETYLNRVKAAERLQRQKRTWNSALVANSLAGVLGSVVLLVDSDAFGKRGEALLALLSISILVASLAVSALGLEGRVRDMQAHYRAVQRLACEAELMQDEPSPTLEAVRHLQARYDDLLDAAENHTGLDRYAAKGHKVRGAIWLVVGSIAPMFVLVGSLGLVLWVARWAVT